ncbi:MAG TPA: undecaprenyl/decaprenyl-phosphate alpha-N-acetylglucosaminyl 1-phosphate transferase, partial [Candidatus Cloacimonetes bacterium]|nr:undecaprenyl/decaprenyl-phosphate alpha-N-acetylglucosaminyl 1-phosphate transferase [Candidatus Cloacimonadota bacterium]
LGYLDDKRKFTAKYKLLFQIGIACLMYYLGFKIKILTNPFGDDIILGIISFPLTIVWFLLVINAFNLIDGIDGLASGIAVIVNLVLFAVGLLFSNKMIMLLALTLIGSNMAFLKYNFYPAKIFMGDTGSLFIGFNIAAISVTGSIQFKGITTMTLLIPIIALTFPISDTFLAIVRRIKKKESIFLADKEHIHHKMMESGYNQKTISIIGYTITFLFGLIAFGFSFASKEILLVILLLLIILLALFFIFTKGLHK